MIKSKTTDLVLCPSVDADRVIAYEIEKTDTSLSGTGEDPNRAARRDTSHVYIQSALLYSTSEGERRIRVHNMAVPLTNMKHLPFEYLDVSATAHFFSRLALNRVTYLLVSHFDLLAQHQRELLGLPRHYRNVLDKHRQIVSQISI